jgi:hypothetical protein
MRSPCGLSGLVRHQLPNPQDRPGGLDELPILEIEPDDRRRDALAIGPTMQAASVAMFSEWLALSSVAPTQACSQSRLLSKSSSRGGTLHLTSSA